MKKETEQLYPVHRFAELAGVTVRALHHYDRLGLLKPTRRSEASYRLYSSRDLLRLEQIVVLKFLGLSLKEIGEFLKQDKSTLALTLERQRQVLAEKRNLLDGTIRAIEAAREALSASREPDWDLFSQIIKDIAMQNENDWTSKYYSDDAKAKIAERAKTWPPELQEQVTRDWNDLFRDIEAALAAKEDPGSDKAQALAGRWKRLVEGFTGGNPEIQQGLNKMYSDQANWPAEQQHHNVVKPEVQAFIMKAMNARKGV